MSSIQAASQTAGHSLAKSSLPTIGSVIRDPQFKVISKNIGEGGEAYIHIVSVGGREYAFKQFRYPGDPFFSTQEERTNTRIRLQEYPDKLKAFPQLPQQVVKPLSIVTDDKKRLLGYTMPLLDHAYPLSRLMTSDGRKTLNLSLNAVTRLFLDLHSLVQSVHQQGAVIGDFRPDNILCRSHRTFIIDAESMQYGKWPCRSFSEQWVDPLLCTKSDDGLVRVKPVTKESDWYSFAAMLFHALTGAHPYGGILIENGRVAKEQDRYLQGKSVFTTGVRLHHSVMDLRCLGPDLVKAFRDIFNSPRMRDPFPRKVLENLVWFECPGCNKEFAGSACPCGCKQEYKINPVKPKITRTTLKIYGEVLASSFDGKTFSSLQYVSTEKKLVRGDGSTVGDLNSTLAYDQYDACGATAALLTGENLILLCGRKVSKLTVLPKQEDAVPTVSGNSKILAALAKSGELILVDPADLTGKQLSIPQGSPVGVWVHRKDGLLLAQTEYQEIVPYIISNDNLEKIKGFPCIIGKLLGATSVATKNTVWLLLSTEDNQVESQYVFSFDRKSKDLKAWSILDGQVPLKIRQKIFTAFEKDGVSHLVSVDKNPKRAQFNFQQVGSTIRVIPYPGQILNASSIYYPYADGIMQFIPHKKKKIY